MEMNLKSNIIVEFAYSENKKEIKDINIKCKKDSKNSKLYQFNLSPIINEVVERNNIKNCAISYFEDELNTYIYCGKYPIKHSIEVQLNENNISTNSINIKLKLRNVINKLNLMRMELIEENHDKIDEKHQNTNINENCRRSKERKIGFIIEKVYLWRKLYNGITDENGVKIQLTLDEAAEKVGIAKKSLDDYLIQLRIGKRNGFNFNEHRNEKVGVLRSFVKKQKNENDLKSSIYGNLELREDN